MASSAASSGSAAPLADLATGGGHPVTPRKPVVTHLLPDAASIHGKELCSLAKRIPGATKGIDDADTEDNKSQHFALVQMVQFFDANPKWCCNIWSHIQHKAYGGASSGKKASSSPESETWDPAYRQVYRIPKNWIAKFLTTAFPNDFSSDKVNLIDAKDPHALQAGFNLIMNLLETSALPTECLVKASR
jgi:hypothetical protein